MSALSPGVSLYSVRSHRMGLTLLVAAAVSLLGSDDPLRTSAALATTNIVPIMIQIAVRVFRFIFYLDGYSIYNALDGVFDLAVPLHASPRSLRASPAAAKLASFISEYLRERITPVAPEVNAAFTAALTSEGCVFFSF